MSGSATGAAPTAAAQRAPTAPRRRRGSRGAAAAADTREAAADAAGIQEDSADEELDEPLGEEVAGADSTAVADSGIAVAES